MIKQLLFIVIVLLTYTSNAQSIFGTWINKNAETGLVNSKVEIYEKDGKAYIKIIEITKEKDRNNLCTKCKGKNKNKPILGMIIADGLTKNGDEWSDGTILDPKTGKVYKCYLKLVEKNKIKIRGYIGISLIGKTKYWYRDI